MRLTSLHRVAAGRRMFSSSPSEITRVGVVGLGLMGHVRGIIHCSIHSYVYMVFDLYLIALQGIAQVSAQNGFQVVAVENNQDQINKYEERKMSFSLYCFVHHSSFRAEEEI